jgi:hypothetical protein
MGTYLRYEVNEPCRKEAGDWLRALSLFDGEVLLGLWDEEDVRIVTEKGERGSPDHLPLGTGQYRLSGADDDELAFVSGVLAQARAVFGLELVDVPSNVGDYLDEEVLKALCDLPAWQARWKAEAAMNKRWEKAREKALESVAKDYFRSGVYLVDSWGDKGAWLLFCQVRPEDRPYWIGITYNIRGEVVKTGRIEHPLPDNLRGDLVRDPEGRGFLAIPLMALGPRGMSGGQDAVWDYLARARDIGLTMHPNLVMIAVYHLRVESVRFGSLTQLGDHGPFVKGTYDVVNAEGLQVYIDWDCVKKEFTKVNRYIRGMPCVRLKRREKLSSTADRLVDVSYPALARIVEMQAEHEAGKTRKEACGQVGLRT